MLKQIPASLSPELVKALMEMGHGDEIVIADGNFPGASHTNKLIRCDGLDIPVLLPAILELFPLDTYVEHAVALMEVAKGDNYKPTIWETYKDILRDTNAENKDVQYVERFDFYERSKKAYAIVTTSDQSLYANIILKKGVI